MSGSDIVEFDLSEHPHNRYNPLKGEWVLVSPQRLKRPWMGQIENYIEEEVPEFDPRNPLCPGVKRANGEVTPDYKSTYVFPNDFPALVEDSPDPEICEDALFKVRKAQGSCRVVCFHPKSNITIPLMTIEEIIAVIRTWIAQQQELGKKYDWVQIFENRGALMGCSNPHPHGQIWASSFLPNEAIVKDKNQLEYYKKYNRPMLLDYMHAELEKEERIVCENDDWLVVVPFWALWPYETMILPKTHIKRITDLNESKIESLAGILKDITSKYDNLFECSFPYTMGWHGAPTGRRLHEESTHWVFHGIYYPPLLRSAIIKKFMVGYEMLAQGQRDMTPEQAAETLRELPTKRFSHGDHFFD